MRRRKIILLASVFSVFVTLAGCATYRAAYDIELYEVERPANAKERATFAFQEVVFNRYSFEDEMVKIVWITGAGGVSFSLENKTDHSIKVMWDDAAYVDENGISHRVMHSGVNCIDRNNPQPPSVVVRRGKMAFESVIPVDSIIYCGQYVWDHSPLFPAYAMDSMEPEKDPAVKLRKEAEKHIGKTFQVLLPLTVEDVVNDYIFIFKINAVDVKKIRRYPWGT